MKASIGQSAKTRINRSVRSSVSGSVNISVCDLVNSSVFESASVESEEVYHVWTSSSVSVYRSIIK